MKVYQITIHNGGKPYTYWVDERFARLLNEAIKKQKAGTVSPYDLGEVVKQRRNDGSL